MRRCDDCYAPMTSHRNRRPGHAYHAGNGRCRPCYDAAREIRDVKDDTARDALKFWTKHPAPGPWRLDGTCAQVDNGTGTDLWFSTDRGEQRQAKEICVTACPVFAECTAYWQATPGIRGIWGGTNDNDRRKWWREREEEEEAGS